MTDTTAGEGVPCKITWVNDASNVNDRRMYVDGQQWAKVYGWDEASLNARCDALAAAMTRPLAAQPSAGAQGEAVARLLWERFAPSSDVDAENANRGEYVLAAKDIDALYATPTDDVVFLSDCVEHSHPSFGEGFFFTPNCIRSISKPDTGDVAALRSILARYPSIRLHAALNKLAALSKPNAPGAHEDGGA